MKIALDPCMLRSLRGAMRIAAGVGDRYIELSPRRDFIPSFVQPRADRERVAEVRMAVEQDLDRPVIHLSCSVDRQAGSSDS